MMNMDKNPKISVLRLLVVVTVIATATSCDEEGEPVTLANVDSSICSIEKNSFSFRMYGSRILNASRATVQ